MTKNIILLTIDALRADHVSWLGYERDTTPFLDEFSERCTVFESAYSASSHTREAVPALLTGRYPSEAVGDGFTRGAETIPMLLPDEYVTAAFHSNPYVSRAYGYDEGFDTFYDDLHLGQNKLLALVQRALNKFVLNRGEYHARAEGINQRALSWVSSRPDTEPFFLWNHYMDVHGPYNPPDGYAQWSENFSNNKAQDIYDRLTGEGPVSESDVQLALNLYDGEVRYVDEQIGAFLEILEERNLLDKSLVIITSDHGDLFGEYGLYAHPRHVYPELTSIPLMISHPEMESDYVETAVSTLDIRSTIIDFNESSPVSGIGKSLLHYNSLDSNRATYSSVLGENEESNRRRFAIQTKDNAYWIERNIKTNKITKEGKIDFDSNQALTTISNPNSLNGTLTTLREKLMEHSKIRLMNENQTKTSLAHDKEVEERLEALGYK